MMSGRFYIDGKDAFTEYGIYVQEGGYNELVAFQIGRASCRERV